MLKWTSPAALAGYTLAAVLVVAGCGSAGSGGSATGTSTPSAATSNVPATHPSTGSGNDSAFHVGDCISDTTQGWVQQPCSQAEDRILAVVKPAAPTDQAWTACMKYAAVRQGWSGGMGQTSDSLDGTVTYCMVTGPAVAAGTSGAPPAVSASNP